MWILLYCTYIVELAGVCTPYWYMWVLLVVLPLLLLSYIIACLLRCCFCLVCTKDIYIKSSTLKQGPDLCILSVLQWRQIKTNISEGTQRYRNVDC